MRELDKEAMFLKDNIAGDTKTMRDRIITPIPLLSFTTAKETKKSGLRLKFVVIDTRFCTHNLILKDG